MISTITDIAKRYHDIQLAADAYDLLQTNEELAIQLENKSAALDETVKLTMYSSLLAAHTWKKHGKNSFSIGESLALALLATETPKDTEVCYPFEAFAFDFPEKVLPTVKQVLVARLTKKGETQARTCICTRLIDGAILWDAHTTINDIDNTETLTTDDKHTMRLVRRLVYNFLLWLASVKPKIYPTKTEKPHTKYELKQEKSLPTEWILGRNVKISPELSAAVRETIINGNSKHAAIKISIRFIVRGHFRNQAHGPNHALHKLIWIEPFMKGPDGAEAWAHIYKA